jgi:hypothetical protein
MEQTMRYVFYAFAMLGVALMWANSSDKGRSVKRQLTSHPVDPTWSH